LLATTDATAPDPHAADPVVYTDLQKLLGIRPPVRRNFLTRRLVKLSWKILRNVVLPAAYVADPSVPPGRCINLECLWMKALAASNRRSPAYDGLLTYDLLPNKSRAVVGPWAARFYPRFVHTVFETRMVYLHGAIGRQIER